ncbi:MAG: hypothetical protein LBH44_11775 [Treponema sp.]|jgi:hypothetical protein|nr:hypothetical protein [Treponema sp.]
MKKTLLVLMILCAVAVLSCGTSGGGSSSPAAPAASKAEGDLGAFSLRLEDNFQYGITYQGMLTNRALFDGKKITAGETYTLRMTYKASRDLEGQLMIGLVDTTEAANYWNSLSWDDAAGVEMLYVDASQKDQEVSATLTLKTLKAATGSSAAANALVFQTEGEGVRGKAGSGVQKQVTLSFSEFIFTKVQ